MSPLKTREWIGILVIVVLVQFMITYISFDFGTSGRALGYVSFAGTIVSIILGVIAILYSFYQSNSQANVVNDIKDQAVRIVEAGDHIVKSKDILFGSADQLKLLAGELSVKLQENNDHSVEFKDLLSRSLSGGRFSDHNLNSASNDVFKTKYYYLDVAYLMIGEYARRNYTWSSFRDKFIAPYNAALELPDNFMEGGVATITFLFESLNMIATRGDDEQQTISFVGDELKNKLVKLAGEVEAVKNKPKAVSAYFDILAGIAD
ncbi:hypothetical protein QUC26_04665 [Pseudomonas asiatica]|uniref:hypothetical protein n=1 Tax=Pseudomonas asiatica TaxID=2219225 RepID=UPI0025A2677E|nr:hypothetical protein [Pseudomonas asiatica]WJM54467.1 hypothetical protein QUC26_04665 [Pseudomonas asiatica]